MRPFAGGTCRSLVFFDNTSCRTCGSELGYDRGKADVVVLDAAAPRCANHGRHPRYPFVLHQDVLDKLRFVHDVVAAAR